MVLSAYVGPYGHDFRSFDDLVELLYLLIVVKRNFFQFLLDASLKI